MKYTHALFEITHKGYRAGKNFKSAFKLFFVLLILLSFADVLPAQNNYYQVQITVNGCQNNPLAGAQVLLDEISADKAVAVLEHYTQLTDSNGVAVFDSVKSSVYNMTVWKPTYDTLTQNNLVVHADYNTIVSLMPIAYPPHAFRVDSLTSIATWKRPMKEVNALPFQDFEDPVFPPPGWQITLANKPNWPWLRVLNGSVELIHIPPGDGYYAVSNSELPKNRHYSATYLITPKIDLRGEDSVYLRYRSFYQRAIGNHEVATVMYCTDTNFNWIALHSPARKWEWIYDSVDLSAFTNPDSSSFYLAFFANDNNFWQAGCWAVDNIILTHGDANPIGYYVFLNNQLIDYIDHDTNSYAFQNLTYGQTYIAGIKAVYDCRTSEMVEYTWTSSYLHPPQNFTTEYTYNTDEVQVSFTPPDIVSSDTSYNPLSFNIYMDNSIANNIPYQGQPADDTIKIIFDSINPGTHTFKASALYELSAYGYPGDTAESMFTNIDTHEIEYGYPLPFFEGWEITDFQFNKWSHSDEGGFWLFDTVEGKPPASVCLESNCSNKYSILTSYAINADSIEDGNIYLEFDLKHERGSIRNAYGFFLIEIYNGIKDGYYWWHTIKMYHASETFDFIRNYYNISQYVKSKSFKIRFRGSFRCSNGEKSKWFIDNIHIYRTCKPPVNLTGEYFWNDSVPGEENFGAKVCWDAPNSSNRSYSGTSSKNSRSVSAFNIYRRGEEDEDYDLYATIPFDTANSSYCFYDSYPNVNTHKIYCYKVTAVWKDVDQCESKPATVYYPYSDSVCVYVTGIEKQNQGNGVKIYPNPANSRIVVQSQYPVSKVEILTLSGTVALKIAGLHQDKTEVDVSQLPAGLYVVKVYGKDGLTSIGKVAIQ